MGGSPPGPSEETLREGVPAAWREAGGSRAAGQGPHSREFRGKGGHRCFLGASWCQVCVYGQALSPPTTQPSGRRPQFPHFTDGATEAERSSDWLCTVQWL